MFFAKHHRSAAIKLIVIVFLLSSATSCRLSRALRAKSECYKYDKAVFEPCVKEKFPIGSNLSDLEIFLVEDGFKLSQNPEDLAAKRFYFKWESSNLTNGFTDYGVVVAGYYDDGLKITEIVVD